MTDRTYRMSFRIFRKGEEKLLAQGSLRAACVAVEDGRFKLTRIPREIIAMLRGE